MSRFGTVGKQYFDNSGKPLSAGTLTFYEPGTTDAKTVYSDSDESVPIAQPVSLDASGRQPDIFFSGQAKVILADSDSVQIAVADPVNDAAPEQFPLWQSGSSYAEGALAQGSDDLLYVSLAASNVGNDPVSSPSQWAPTSLIETYNSARTYQAHNIVFHSNTIWRCNTDDTSGVTPSTGASEWDLLCLPMSGGTLTGALTATGLTSTGGIVASGTLTGVTSLTMSGTLTGASVFATAASFSSTLGVTGKLTASSEAQFDAAITQPFYEVTDGASVTLDPANGVRQTWTLGANRTPSGLTLSDGQELFLGVDDGSGRTLDLSGIVDEWVGPEPSLATSGFTWIYFWQKGTTVYAVGRS